MPSVREGTAAETAMAGAPAGRRSMEDAGGSAETAPLPAAAAKRAPSRQIRHAHAAARLFFLATKRQDASRPPMLPGTPSAGVH
jgi:hypothetical protein